MSYHLVTYKEFSGLCEMLECRGINQMAVVCEVKTKRKTHLFTLVLKCMDVLQKTQ